MFYKKLETVLGERDNQLKEASVSLEMANTELRELQKKYRDEKKFQEEILTNLQEKNQRLEAEMIVSNCDIYIIYILTVNRLQKSTRI